MIVYILRDQLMILVPMLIQRMLVISWCICGKFRLEVVSGSLSLRSRKVEFLAHLKPIADENDFHSCLTSYFGPQVSRIRNAIDSKCKTILEDLLCFVDSHNSAPRLKELVPYLQEKFYKTISGILNGLESELGKLSASLRTKNGENDMLAASIIVERSLFIGRFMFALRYHLSHVPLILGSPRQWVKEADGVAFMRLSSPSPRHSRASLDTAMPFTPRRHTFDSPRSPGKQFSDNSRRQTIAASASLFGADDSSNPRLDELNKTLQALCIAAHGLWITWLSTELSHLLSYDLNKNDSLSSSTPLRGWKVTVIKQEESTEGPLEMQIALPSMPSLYIISFLYQACLEIHKLEGTSWTNLYCKTLHGSCYRRLLISMKTFWHQSSLVNLWFQKRGVCKYCSICASLAIFCQEAKVLPPKLLRHRKHMTLCQAPLPRLPSGENNHNCRHIQLP